MATARADARADPPCQAKRRRREERGAEGGAPSLDDLVSTIREHLGGDEVDVATIKRAMEEYVSNGKDWWRFCNWDPHKYTRNLVDEGDGRYNLMVLCWPEGIASSIHDHAGSHCVMKVLDGELTEELFDWPEDTGAAADSEMVPCKATTFERDAVHYMHDELGLHRICNPSHVQGAVSLHLYSPPVESCRCFDQATGRARCSGNITFCSRGGKKVTPPGL